MKTIWLQLLAAPIIAPMAILAAMARLPAPDILTFRTLREQERVGSSDSEQFAEKRIPRITVHSLTQKSWDERILHTRRDKFAEIKFDDYYQTYRLMAAYLVFLDQLPGSSSPSRAN